MDIAGDFLRQHVAKRFRVGYTISIGYVQILFERMVYFMLKRFALRNFKNFRDEIEIDFGSVEGYKFSTDCISDGVIAKMLI